MQARDGQAVVIWANGETTYMNMGSLDYYRRRFNLIYAGSEGQTHFFKHYLDF